MIEPDPPRIEPGHGRLVYDKASRTIRAEGRPPMTDADIAAERLRPGNRYRVEQRCDEHGEWHDVRLEVSAADVDAVLSDRDRLKKRVKELERKWTALREERTSWPDALREAVAALETQHDCEMVSIEHHATWVDRAESAESELAQARKELERAREAVTAIYTLADDVAALTWEETVWEIGRVAAAFLSTPNQQENPK